MLEVKGETVYSWVKKALWAWELLRILAKQKGRHAPGQRPAKLISFDKMWTYLGARQRDKRRECWIWTAVVEEWGRPAVVDFEVGDRSEAAFLKLYGRLPEAEQP